MDLRIINSWYLNLAKTCFVIVFVCGVMLILKQVFSPENIGQGHNKKLCVPRKSQIETQITVITEIEMLDNRTYLIEKMIKELNKLSKMKKNLQNKPS